MKYLLPSMFIFFIPLNVLCQRYHQSFGVFLPGDFNKNYIRVTGKIYGLEFKNHYLPGNVGYGGSIQVGFYQNVVNFNISEYAQVLPALNKSQSMRLLLKVVSLAFWAATVTMLVTSIAWVWLVFGGVLRCSLVPGLWTWACTTTMTLLSGTTAIRGMGCQFVAQGIDCFGYLIS